MNNGNEWGRFEKRKPIRQVEMTIVRIEKEKGRVLAREGDKEPVFLKVPSPEWLQPGERITFDIKGASMNPLKGGLIGDIAKIYEIPPEPGLDALLSPTPEETPDASFAPPPGEEEEEVALYPDEGPTSASLERKEDARAVPEHAVSFRKEEGRFVVRASGAERVIVNARDEYLLPTDIVAISEIGDDKARVENVAYGSPRTVAGYIEEEEARGRNKGGLVFVVRIPGSGARRVLYKFKLPVDDIPDAERLHKERRPVLFDREARRYVDPTAKEDLSNSYKELRWMTLTNLGVYQYDDERKQQSKEEQAELDVLAAMLGVDRKSDPASWSEQMEPALNRLAEREASFGAVEDFRGKKTFYVDPSGSRDHDDVFSYEPLEDGWSEVGIHIADVSRFIEAGSALDIEAEFRGSSMYLDDLTIRMLDPLLSEHLASLKAGRTRFAFSLVFEAKRDDQKGVRVRKIRLVPSVVKVTDGMTYTEAQRDLDGSDTGERASALRRMRDLVEGLYERVGIRQIGDGEDDGSIDSHRLVAELMNAMNRVAGAGYERLKRSGKERVRMVQDVVFGIYRRHEIGSERAEKDFTNALEKLGIVTADEAAKVGDFDAIVAESRRRVERGDFDPGTTEEYYHAAFRAMRHAETGYATRESRHFAMGGIRLSRVSSPIRRYADLEGQRTLKFLLRIDKRSKGADGDISEEDARGLMREYAETVLGIPLDVPEAVTLEEFGEHVSVAAEKHLARVLAHSSVREGLSRHAENAAGALQAVNTLYRKIHGRFWKRGRELSGGTPIPLPNGLVIDVPEGGERRFAGEIFGEARISYKNNSDLAEYVSGRVRDQGVSLQVKFRLPEGMQHPLAWCRAQGLSRCQMKLAASIVDVEVEQGRLVLALAKNARYQNVRRGNRPRRA